MDSEYVIDCAFELAETTPVENSVLTCSRGAYESVRSMVDADLEMPVHFLQNTARARMQEMNTMEQYFYALKAIPSVSFGLKSLSEKAQCLIQMKAQNDLRIRDMDPFRSFNLWPELSAVPERIIYQDSELGEGVVREMLNSMLSPMVDRWKQDLSLMNEALQWYQSDGGQGFRKMLSSSSTSDNTPVAMNSLLQKAAQIRQQKLKIQEKKERSLKSKAISAIKKATKLFENLGQEQNLGLFISGHEVTLQHPASNLKFVIQPLQVQGWLIDRTITGRTHTPYELKLFTKDDVYLSKLCVYFDSTPVLDQLLSLTLFVNSGDEVQLLEKANWFAISDWTKEKSQAVLQSHPQLESKLPKQRDSQDLMRNVVFNSQFVKEQAHWAPFKGRVEQWVSTWMEPAFKSTHQIQGASREVRALMDTNRKIERQIKTDEMKEILRNIDSLEVA